MEIGLCSLIGASQIVGMEAVQQESAALSAAAQESVLLQNAVSAFRDLDILGPQEGVAEAVLAARLLALNAPALPGRQEQALRWVHNHVRSEGARVPMPLAMAFDTYASGPNPLFFADYFEILADTLLDQSPAWSGKNRLSRSGIKLEGPLADHLEGARRGEDGGTWLTIEARKRSEQPAALRQLDFAQTRHGETLRVMVSPSGLVSLRHQAGSVETEAIFDHNGLLLKANRREGKKVVAAKSAAEVFDLLAPVLPQLRRLTEPKEAGLRDVEADIARQTAERGRSEHWVRLHQADALAGQSARNFVTHARAAKDGRFGADNEQNLQFIGSIGAGADEQVRIRSAEVEARTGEIAASERRRAGLQRDIAAIRQSGLVLDREALVDLILVARGENRPVTMDEIPFKI